MLRYVPALAFEPDRSFDNAQRIDALLQSAKPPSAESEDGA